MTNFFLNTPTPPLLEKNPDDSCTNPSILKKFIYYLLIFGTGIINAFLNPYFFRFLSSILFTTEELHFFAFSPLFSPSLLLFLVFYLITEIITVSVLTSYFLRHFYYDSKNFLLSFAVLTLCPDSIMRILVSKLMRCMVHLSDLEIFFLHL